jgi:hypothetical protein
LQLMWHLSLWQRSLYPHLPGTFFNKLGSVKIAF